MKVQMLGKLPGLASTPATTPILARPWVWLMIGAAVVMGWVVVEEYRAETSR